MKNITIALSESMVTAIDKLVDLGFYPSRSECLRTGITQFLPGDIRLQDMLAEDKFSGLKADQMSRAQKGAH